MLFYKLLANVDNIDKGNTIFSDTSLFGICYIYLFIYLFIFTTQYTQLFLICKILMRRVQQISSTWVSEFGSESFIYE